MRVSMQKITDGPMHFWRILGVFQHHQRATWHMKRRTGFSINSLVGYQALQKWDHDDIVGSLILQGWDWSISVQRDMVFSWLMNNEWICSALALDDIDKCPYCFWRMHGCSWGEKSLCYVIKKQSEDRSRKCVWLP